MKTNTLSENNIVKHLTVIAELRDELEPLTEEELKSLKQSIIRDGIHDNIKYWINPETAQYELIDGHNRKRIADELGIEYGVTEIQFPFPSRTAVKLWMHLTQAGRRGGQARTERVATLKTLLAEERGLTPSKTQIVKETAQDLHLSERTVWRAVDKTDKPKQSALDRLIAAFLKLSESDKQVFRDAIK